MASDDITPAAIQTEVKEDTDGGQEKVVAQAAVAINTAAPAQQISRNSSQKSENGKGDTRLASIDHKQSIGKGDGGRDRVGDRDGDNHVEKSQTDDSIVNDVDGGAAAPDTGNQTGPPIYSNSNNSSITRTLTQQSSLVSPSEISISISPTLTAEPVITPGGKHSICPSLIASNWVMPLQMT